MALSEICETYKDTREAAKELGRPGPSHQLNAVGAKPKHDGKKQCHDKKHDSGDKTQLWKCTNFCGEKHVRGHKNCKAYGTTCTKCGRRNHFEEVCRKPPKAGCWVPRSKAAKEHHRRMIEEKVYDISDVTNDNEIQRDAESPRPGYDTDTEPVRDDSSDSGEEPPRRVHVKPPGTLKITTRSTHDLWNQLQREGEKHKERYVEVISEAVQIQVPEMNENSQSSRDRRSRHKRETRRRRRSPSPHRHHTRSRSPHQRSKKPDGPGSKAAPEKGRRTSKTHETRKTPTADSPKDVPTPDTTPHSGQDESSESDTANQVSQNSRKPRTWDKNVSVNGRMLKMKINSGSTVNTLSLKDFQRLGFKESILQPPRTTIRTYSKTVMQSLGEFTATVTLRGRRSAAKFLVLDKDVPPLLGLPTGADLALFHMARQSIIQWFTDADSEFEGQFEGINAVEDEFLRPCQKVVELKLKDGANPVVIPARRVPLALREEVHAELQRMQRMGVITPVHEPRPWCHAMVVARKPNGKLRICIDPRALNPWIEREEMMIPDIDNLIVNLNEAKVMTLLDLEAGFWQVGVDEQSARLLTFATPWGRFQYNCLPFGISVALEIFHKAVVDALQDIPGVIIYVDDVLIYGKDQQEHDKCVRLVKQRLEECGCTTNKAKAIESVSRVKFLGHIVGDGQVLPHPDKIHVILEHPKPRSVEKT